MIDPASLPKPLRRAAALGLLALVLALSALACAAPFMRLAAVSDEITAATQEIARRERSLRTAARHPAQDARNVLLTGETIGIAGASLQGLVAELARNSGLSLRSANVAAPKREADLTAISVDVGLQGQTPALRDFLHAIETGVPMLFVDNLSIKSVEASAPAQQPAVLDVTLRVRGYGAGKQIN